MRNYSNRIKIFYFIIDCKYYSHMCTKMYYVLLKILIVVNIILDNIDEQYYQSIKKINFSWINIPSYT